MRKVLGAIVALVAAAGLAGPAQAGSPSALVTLSHAPDPVTSGHTVGYATAFTNQGPNTLTHVKLALPAPGGATAVLAQPSGSCTVSPSAAACSFGSVASGATVSATVVLRAPVAAGSFTTTSVWSVDESFNDTPNPDPHRDTFLSSDVTHIQAPSQDAVAEYVLPSGDTVTTNPGSGATATNPQVTTVVVPATPSGVPTTAAEVAASGPSDSCGPAADCFGQVSVLTVVAPPFPDTGPLRLIFDLDASEIPHGIHVADIAVYHNSIAVPDCAGAAGVAAPDPCVAGRLENKRTKDVEITVLSSRNGRFRM